MIIKVFKLVNGDNVMGVVDEEEVDASQQHTEPLDNYDDEEDEEVLQQEDDTDDTIDIGCIFLRDPMRLIQIYSPETKRYSIHIVQWLPYSNDEITPIAKSAILNESNPSGWILDHYTKAVDVLMDERAREEADLQNQRAMERSIEEKLDKPNLSADDVEKILTLMAFSDDSIKH